MIEKKATLELTQDELLKRIAREIDRFSISLMQIEVALSKIVEKVPDEICSDVSQNFQTIDYLSQSSAAISEILTKIADNDQSNCVNLVHQVKPKDLSHRLLDKQLEDIDNRASAVTFF